MSVFLQNVIDITDIYCDISSISVLTVLSYGRNTHINSSSSSGAEHSGSDKDDGSCAVHQPSLLLIMKWGGELTPFGREQAVEMGKACRCVLNTLQVI